MTENDIKLVKTCSAFPEQYDAYHEGKAAGYLRLRWGHFRVDYPDVGGEAIYEARLDDDLRGEFDDEEERKFYLDKAKQAILKKLKGSP